MNKWFEDNNAKQTADFEEGRKKIKKMKNKIFFGRWSKKQQRAIFLV